MSLIVRVKPEFKNLPRGHYGVYVQGELVKEEDVEHGSLDVEASVRDETSIVILLL